MTQVTWNKSKSQYATVWKGSEPIRSKYAYWSANSVTSTRGRRIPFSKRVNPLSITKTSFDFTDGLYIDANGVRYSGRTMALLGLVDQYSGGYPSMAWNSDASRVSALAAQKLYKKASEPYFREIHQFGELAETISALKKPLSGIRSVGESLYKSFKNPRHAKLPIKEIAGTHLEILYGVIPAVAQAGVLGDAVGRILDKKFAKLKTVKAGSKYTYGTADPVEFSVYVGGLSRPIFDHHTLTYKYEGWVDSKAGAGMYISNPRLRNSHNIGSIAAEGWELLPLSFFANMFVDLSSLLQECRPIPGTIEDSWLTSVVNSRSSYTLTRIHPSLPIFGPEITTIRPAKVVISKCYIRRVRNVSRTGKLHLGPGLDSVGKILSTASLGISRFL